MKFRGWAVWHFFLLFLRQFYREPAALFWSFGFPLLAALLIAPAMNNDVRTRFRIGVQHGAQLSSQLVNGLRTDPLFTPVVVTLTPSQSVGENLSPVFMKESLDAVITERGIYVPQGGGGGLLMERLLDGIGRPPSEIRMSVSRVPLVGQRFLDWFVPGLIGLGLLSNGLFFVAVRIVLERSTGFFKRLRLSPFRKSSYLGGFAVAYSLLCFLHTSILTGVFFVGAGFRVQGAFFEFVLLGTLGGAVFGLLGLALAARIKTVPVATGVANMFYFPMMFLCGVYFRSESFPEFMQPLVEVLPLTALNSGLRAIANGGASILSLGRELLVFAVWAAMCAAFVARFFRWGKD
jgi:ABC-2 type transport system permease protein